MGGWFSTPSIPTGRPLRIVLIGQTGVGKSTVGNTILGRKAFTSWPSANSVTENYKREGMFSPREIEVIDTPGIIDTFRESGYIKNEIVKCIKYSTPGPHAFLLVMQRGRITEVEQNAVKALNELFGGKAADYMMFLFTHADGQNGFDDVRQGHAKLMSYFGGRFHVFTNRSTDHNQVVDLVKKIDEMVKTNGGGHFTEEMTYSD